jgi:hypothetical protein
MCPVSIFMTRRVRLHAHAAQLMIGCACRRFDAVTGSWGGQGPARGVDRGDRLLLTASQATHAEEPQGIPLPFPTESVWQVVNGYNTITHADADPHALDFTRLDAPAVGTEVLAPVPGQVDTSVRAASASTSSSWCHTCFAM